MSTNRVSTYISNSLPDFVREDYNSFVNFIKDIYKSQERRGSSIDILRNILSTKNISTYETLSVTTTFLRENISDSDEIIRVDDASFLPMNNGVIKIGDEIILYKEKNGDYLEGCYRGASYLVEITDIYNQNGYSSSKTNNHNQGDLVEDLTLLVFSEFLNKNYSTFVHNIGPNVLHPSIKKSTVLEHIQSFYRSKGSEGSIYILLKLLYGENETKVFYPGDKVYKSSDSNWFSQELIRCSLVSGDINLVRDNTLFQQQSNFTAQFLVEDVRPVLFGDRTIYDIVINKIKKIGQPIPSAKTILTRPVSIGDRTITVESTYGFPQNAGTITIGNEIINYSYTTNNQFRECVRGLNNTNQEHHFVGDEVFDFIPLIAYGNNGQEVILKCLQIVNKIEIFDGGILNTTSDLYSKGYPESNPTNVPLIDSWQRNESYSLSKIYDSTIADVSSFTSGVTTVHYDLDDNVIVQSSSIPPYVIGPFGNESSLDLIPLGSAAFFPRNPKISNTKVNVGDESIGMFIDGVLAQSHKVNSKIYYGGVSEIKLISGGNGYANPPTIIINSDSGSGAQATCTIDNEGRVDQITIVQTGSGYTSPPDIRFTSGENAIITITTDRYGRIISTTVVNGGVYYNYAPKLTIVDSLGRGRGGLLSIDPTKIVNGVIQPDAVTIVDKGIDYSNQTYVLVEPIGTDADAEVIIPSYSYDSVYYVNSDSNKDFDSNGGYVYPRRKNVDVVRNTYCYSNNPITLRNLLNDNIFSEKHSPIIGWAFDGYPIYGPFAYENKNEPTSDIVRMTSSWRLRSSRIGVNAPSTSLFPLGSFVEDYEYVEGLGSLDEHNGRWCITPEYPNGTYAYFITVDEDDNPLYPYIIGPTFYALPLSQNIDFMGSISRNTYGYTSILNERYYGENNIIQYDINRATKFQEKTVNELYTVDITGKLTSSSTGSLSDILVDYSDGTYVVGDELEFDYPETSLGTDLGCEALVTWIVGKDVSSMSVAIPNVDVILREQTITFDNVTRTILPTDINEVGNFIEFSTPHGLLDRSRVIFTNVSGDLPDGLEDRRSYYVKVVNSSTISLHRTISDYSNNIVVEINSVGTGSNNITPVYAFIVGSKFTTENNCSFEITSWNPSTATLGIRVIGQIDTSENDIFVDLVNAKVEILTIDTPSIGQSNKLIPVTDSSSFYAGDTIRIGDEIVYVEEILANNTLKVQRDSLPNDPIVRGTAVTNLTRLAIIIDTVEPHEMKVGDTVEIIDAIPNIFNGRTTVDLVENINRFVCFKKLSKEDIQFILNEPITDPDRGISYITSTKPYFLTNPTQGTLWWSFFSGILYVRYNDSDSGQWVMATPTGVVPHLLNDEIVSVTGGDIDIFATGLSGGDIIISDIAPSTRVDSTPLKKGDMWWSSASGFLYVFYKTSTQDGVWVPATPTGLSGRSDEGAIAPDINYSSGTGINKQATVTVSEYSPVGTIENPLEDGDLWWSSKTGNLYIRYSSKWVAATPVATRPGEGALEKSISLTSDLFVKYVEILSASGPYYFITNSPSIIGPIGRVQLTSYGENIPVLPEISGVYPREVDRSIHQLSVDSNGSILFVSTIFGGNRYSNPQVKILTKTGTGATFNVNHTNGSITSIDVLLTGEGYTENDQVLIIDTENILVAKTNTIGQYQTGEIYLPGAFQNSDPTIVPNFEFDMNISVYDVVGSFDVNAEVLSQSGRFSAIVKYWSAKNRVLTLRNVRGSLSENEIITSLYVPPITSEDYGLITEDEESTEDYGLVTESVTEDDNYGKLFEFSTTTAKVCQSGQAKLTSRTGSVVLLEQGYNTDYGLISESYSKIHDSYFYQNFSYVIESSIRPTEYRPFVMKNIHPIGYIMFGQLVLSDSLSITQTMVDSEILISE